MRLEDVPAAPPKDGERGDGLEACAKSVGKFDRAAQKRLQDELDELGRTDGDNRTGRACWLIFIDYGRSVDEGWPLLRAWNGRRHQPHDEGELRRRMVRALNHKGDARRGDKVWDVALKRRRKTKAAKKSTSNTPNGDFAAALRKAHVDVETAFGTHEHVVPQPLFEPAINLFTRDYPPTPWLVRGLMTEGGIGVIATHPKTGKTWAATEIAMAVATGTHAFGEFETGVPKRVAYFYAEDGALSVRNRVRALAASRDIDVQTATANLIEQTRGRYIDLCDPDSVALVIASCRQFGDIALLVIDPMRDVHSGSENDSDEMRGVMRTLRVIGDLLRCTVLFVHHAAKASGEGGRGGIRGSSAIEGAVDCIIKFPDQSGDGRNVFVNKVTSIVKGARSAGPFTLTLSVEDNETDEAVRATWSVDRPNEKQQIEDDVAALVDAVIAQGPKAWRDLRSHCGMGPERAEVARAYALEKGVLEEVVEPYTNTRRQKRKRKVLHVAGGTL